MTVGLGACFSPQPPTGAPCPDGVCPSGLQCSPVTQTCEKPGTGGPVDAPDMPIDAQSIDTALVPDAQGCFGSGIVMVCPAAPVTAPLSFVNGTTIDTGTSPSCIAYTGTAGLCVVAGTQVSVAANLTAIGTKPLVILATNTLTVDAAVTISVASRTGMPAGAGADPTACVAGTAAIDLQGGAGGSFGGRGGRGASLDDPNGPLAATPATAPVATLRGGCKGGNGAGTNPGAGGNGGGAVYLIAQSSLTMNGTINASGAGGGRATNRGGGGGGGTGGMIVLDSASVTIPASAVVFANGGGGGEGGTLHKTGNAGADPLTATTAAAGGVNGAPHGGNGGSGAAGATRDGAAGRVSNQCTGTGGEAGKGAGAGGGGGGAGVIRIFAASQTIAGTLSPAAN